MLNARLMRRAAGLGAASLMVIVLATCDKVPTPPEPSPAAARVDALLLSTGTHTVTLYRNGKITLAPLTFLRPSADLTVTLLDDQGNPIQDLGPDDVVVNFGTDDDDIVDIDRTGPYTAELEFGGDEGATKLQIALFDVVKRRLSFGPYPVPVVPR